MSSLAHDPLVRPPADPGARLSALAAGVGVRLADLLDAVLPAGGEAGRAAGFLRAVAPAGEEPGWGADDDPLGRVVAAFGLSPLEVDVLLLAGLPEEHEGYAGVLRTLHPRGEPRPTAGLAAQLFCRGAGERRLLRAVLEGGAAARAGVVVLGEEGPFFERSLLTGDALWSALHGAEAWPRQVRVLDGAPVTAGLRRWLATPEAARACRAIRGDERCTVLVTAESDAAAMARGAALVAEADRVPVRLGAPRAGALDRVLSVHAVARDVVPVVAVPAGDAAGAAEPAVLEAHPGALVVCGPAGAARLPGDRPVLEVHAPRPGPADRHAMWDELLPELAGHAASLAARFTVGPETAAAAAVDARAAARLAGRAPGPEDVAAGVRARTALSLSSGVRLLRPSAGWEQLVLPPARVAHLREALERLRHQERVLDEWKLLAGRPGARGVRMLFAGPSGTGKTLAAEVMATALGVDLLLVDISRVVSKWIGETEKNLAEVFDAAERAQAVLFFDEADALFGKRTEVSDAHDRYANLETAFLLTRLERFEGLAILSTNLRRNIDPAFLRRLEFILDFEEPEQRERVALWRCHLPDTAPLADDVSLRELAALYPVVGALIRNAATAAAFRAAADGSPITRAHLVRAVRREYEKAGRAFPGPPAGMNAS